VYASLSSALSSSTSRRLPLELTADTTVAKSATAAATKDRIVGLFVRFDRRLINANAGRESSLGGGEGRKRGREFNGGVKLSGWSGSFWGYVALNSRPLLFLALVGARASLWALLNV
jgi:hypothetical protein